MGICGRGREEGKHEGEGRAEVGAMVSTKAGRRVDVCAVMQSDRGKDKGGLCVCASGKAVR